MKKKIKWYFNKFNLDDSKKLFNKLEKIHKFLEEYNIWNIWTFDNFITTYVFLIIYENNKNDFIKLVYRYFETWNLLSIKNTRSIIKQLFDLWEKPEFVYNFLKSNNYLYKENILQDFFELLPSENVNEYFTNELIEFYRNNNLEYYNNYYDFIIKYYKYNEKIFINIFWEILSKVNDKNINNIVHSLKTLFYSKSDVNKNIFWYFQNNIPLLKKIYFLCERKGTHNDYDWNMLNKFQDADDDFIIEYIDFLLNNFSSMYDVDSKKYKK
jgi:hypothetical protein